MQSLQQGAAAGVILVVLKLVSYLLGIEAMTSGWVGFGQLVLVVAGMFMACAMERKAVDGAFTFGEAFMAALVAAADAVVDTSFVMTIETAPDSEPGLGPAADFASPLPTTLGSLPPKTICRFHWLHYYHQPFVAPTAGASLPDRPCPDWS